VSSVTLKEVRTWEFELMEALRDARHYIDWGTGSVMDDEDPPPMLKFKMEAHGAITGAEELYALHEARSRRVALASAESPAWTVDQLAAGCCSGVNGGGTVRCPTGRASSSARRRARVVAQYFGASSR